LAKTTGRATAGAFLIPYVLKTRGALFARATFPTHPTILSELLAGISVLLSQPTHKVIVSSVPAGRHHRQAADAFFLSPPPKRADELVYASFDADTRLETQRFDSFIAHRVATPVQVRRL
jgi:hypothetical protein